VNVMLEQPVSPREPMASREEIDACNDLEALSEWFVDCDRRELDISNHLYACRQAEIDDENWFRRSAGALAYSRIAKVWIERRILTLGGVPPYFPTDPRSRQLRILNETVEKLKRRVELLEKERG
jgi:hypothetical protein